VITRRTWNAMFVSSVLVHGACSSADLESS
jgi:hypothetical protein